MRGVDEEQRIPVRRSLEHGLGRNVSGRASSVLDDELLAEAFRQPLTNEAGDDVVRPAGDKADDDTDWPRGITLGACNPRHRRQRGGAGGEMEKLPTVGKFHAAALPGRSRSCRIAARRSRREAGEDGTEERRALLPLASRIGRLWNIARSRLFRL